MKSLSFAALREVVEAYIQKITGHRLFKDRLSVAMLIPTVIINLSNLILLLMKVHPSGLVVPIRYSNLNGFDELGRWYEIYYIGIFACAVTLINTILAAASFPRSRITSFFMLVASFVVGLFCLVISAAFAAIV